VRTLVWLLIEEIASVGERVLGGWWMIVGGRPAHGEQFGGGFAMARHLAVNSGHERYISFFLPQLVFRFRDDTGL